MEPVVEDGRVVLRFETGEEAFISFSTEPKEGLIVVTTTFVPESQRGKGVAGRLTKKLVELADEKGYKIYPLCSYTRKYLKRKRPDLIAE